MIHHCRSRFWTSSCGEPMAYYEVLLDGVKYRCNEHELDRLYDGVDPADLDLEPITGDDEEEDEFDFLEAAHFLKGKP